MSRFFGSVFHTGYVVEDLEPAIDHWTRTLGVGPFYAFPTPLAFSWLKSGGQLTDRYDILGAAAVAYSGDFMIELIVPGPDPSPYREFLDQGRSGVHHLGILADDFDACLAAARARGTRVAMEGQLPISRFAYLDTDRTFPGTLLEIIDAYPEMLAILDKVKAAARDWDGSDPLRSL